MHAFFMSQLGLSLIICASTCHLPARFSFRKETSSGPILSVHSWLPPWLCPLCEAGGHCDDCWLVSMATADESAPGDGRAASLRLPWSGSWAAIVGAGGGEELEGWRCGCEIGGSPSGRPEDAPSLISVQSLVPYIFIPHIFHGHLHVPGSGHTASYGTQWCF